MGAEIAQRLKLPAVVGEIAAGCLVGPSVLGWVKINEPLVVLAEIGAVLLLFSVGLETRLRDLKRVRKGRHLCRRLWRHPALCDGAGWAVMAGFPNSKGHVRRHLGRHHSPRAARSGVLGRTESRVILGAAVIDDILAMLLLGVVTAIQGGGTVNVWGLLLVLVQALLFVSLIGVVGTRVMKRASPILDAPINPLSPLTLCLAGCLGLAFAAAYLGLAAIIGAFLAGMVAAESQQRHTLEKQVQAIMAFLVPFFFVVTGAQVELAQLAGVPVMLTLLLVTVLAVVGKLVGCGLAARSLGNRSALIVGVGMIPRGEVGIIVASLGKQAGVFAGSTYAIIIAMSLLTLGIAPPVLKALLANVPPEERPEGDADQDVSLLRSVEETGHAAPRG